MKATAKKFGKFIKLKYSDKVIVFQASILLTIIKILIIIFGIRHTYAVLNKLPTSKRINSLEKSSIYNVNKFIQSISNNLPFKTQCIERAITLWILLKLRGIESYLRIGIKDAKNDFNAHAWVEINGEIIGSEDFRKEDYLEFDYKFFFKSDKR